MKFWELLKELEKRYDVHRGENNQYVISNGLININIDEGTKHDLNSLGRIFDNRESKAVENESFREYEDRIRKQGVFTSGLEESTNENANFTASYNQFPPDELQDRGDRWQKFSNEDGRNVDLIPDFSPKNFFDRMRSQGETFLVGPESNLFRSKDVFTKSDDDDESNMLIKTIPSRPGKQKDKKHPLNPDKDHFRKPPGGDNLF